MHFPIYVKTHCSYMLCFLSYGYYKGLKQQKWQLASLKVTGNCAIRQVIHDFLLVFHCNYVSILHHFQDIHTDYFPKFKEVKWPSTHTLEGQLVNPKTNTSHGQPVYKIWSL